MAKTDKKARNIELYNARLAKLQARQAQAKQLRSQGFLGNDDEVIRQFEKQEAAARDEAINAHLATINARIAARQAAIDEQRERENDLVARALNGPAAKDLTRWLAGRPATFQRVKRFFNQRVAANDAKKAA